MLVEFQLRQNTFEPRVCVIGHLMILTGVSVCVERAPSPAALMSRFRKPICAGLEV